MFTLHSAHSFLLTRGLVCSLLPLFAIFLSIYNLKNRTTKRIVMVKMCIKEELKTNNNRMEAEQIAIINQTVFKKFEDQEI